MRDTAEHVRRRLLVLLLALSLPALAHEVTPPKLSGAPTAACPDHETCLHELVVPLLLTVGPDGRVQDAEVDVSLGEPFDSAALRTARGWDFEPARTADGPVAAKVRAAVRFLASEAPTVAREPEPRLAPAEPTPVKLVGHGEEEHVNVHVHGAPPPRTASESQRDRRVLGAAPHRTASDLLTTVPGVFVSQHSGEGKAHQIFFRGFDAVHGQDIEIWVAGAPVNEVSNVHGQGYADLHFVMPEVVRQVRALPGPYSPRQGDFAVAGTMLFDLGYPEPGFTAKASAGSFGAKRGFLAFHPAGESEETFAAAEVYETDGFGVGRSASRASAIAQWLHPLADELSLRLMATTYSGRFGSAGVLRLSDIESGRVDRFDSYDTRQGGHSTRSSLLAEVTGGVEHWQLRFAPYVVWRTLSLRSNYTGYLVDPVNGDTSEQLNDATTVGLNASLERQLSLLSDHDSIEVGVFGRQDSISQSISHVSTLDGHVVDTPVDADVKAVDAGGYVDVAVRPVRRVVLRAGVRADGLGFSTRSGGARSAQGVVVGKKATLDVAVAPWVHAVGSYGEGFRSPQARSLGDGEKTPFTTVQSLELGLRYADGKRLRASIAGFRTTLSEDLVFDETTARNEPVPGTLRLGAVADVVAEPTPWFTSALGATYTRATFRESQGSRYEKGALLPFVPQVVVRSDIAVRPTLARVWGRDLVATAGVGLTTLFRRPIPYGELGHDVFLMDARASARLREVELGIEAFNLLGADWYDGEFVYASSFDRQGPLSSLPVRHVTAGPPRSVLASVTVYL